MSPSRFSRKSIASCSSMSRAYISSLARIFLARPNICFSPVERPLSRSRIDRFRTTSASSKMSPVLILSRLCLKRRFQFFGICVPSSRSTARTSSTVSSPMTLRRPADSAFSHGDHDRHVVVEDLDRQVLAPLPEDLLQLLLDDVARTVMRVHDLVADLVQPRPLTRHWQDRLRSSSEGGLEGLSDPGDARTGSWRRGGRRRPRAPPGGRDRRAPCRGRPRPRDAVPA